MMEASYFTSFNTATDCGETPAASASRFICLMKVPKPFAVLPQVAASAAPVLTSRLAANAQILNDMKKLHRFAVAIDSALKAELWQIYGWFASGFALFVNIIDGN
jgi:hypothetical protein